MLTLLPYLRVSLADSFAKPTIIAFSTESSKEDIERNKESLLTSSKNGVKVATIGKLPVVYCSQRELSNHKISQEFLLKAEMELGNAFRLGSIAI